jgi:tetratricopeptide (TPR) repeat protein
MSTFAMALALAGGALAATAGLSSPVVAQEYSEAFVEAYDPVGAVVFSEDGNGDVAPLEGQLQSIANLAQSPDEKNAAGNLLLEAGNQLNSPALQRRGIELQLAAGKLNEGNTRLFTYYLGRLAYQMGDYAVAVRELQKAIDLGHSREDAAGLLIEAHIGNGDQRAAVNAVISETRQLNATGATVPQDWLFRGLAVAYANDMGDAAVELTSLLVKNHPADSNWMAGLQVVNAVFELETDVQLDLLRLMRATNSLTARSEYIMYIENSDPRIMSNEANAVLEEGRAKDEFQATGDDYYDEIKAIVAERMDADRADAPELVAEAEGDATGEGAIIAADVLYSLADYAGAEAMYALAVAKGGVDTNQALTRLGMSQALQGKSAEAVATLGRVTGPRADVASLWATYAELNAM